MEKRNIGDKLQIHSYKHNGVVYKAWDEAVLLDIQKDYFVFGNNRTVVTEVNGSKRTTKEPAIMYFFKHEWFNIIAQLKKNGIYYYCNIATPLYIEDQTIKNIDYDLDLRIFPTGEFKILDKLEYQYHKKEMHYSEELDKVIHLALSNLIKKYKRGEIMFDTKRNLSYHNIYIKLCETSKNV